MKIKLLALCLLPLATACSSGPLAKSALDDEVRRLCAIDGGIKVYETVRLPASRFDKWGNFEVRDSQHLSNADEFVLEWDVIYLRKDNPTLLRSHHKIIRRADGKLMGQSVMYARGGGDFPGPWHDSSFSCPEPSKQTSLESSIFVKE